MFDEPWQAQVLAMADLLIQSNQLSAGDWSTALGRQLESVQDIADGLDDDREKYYLAALSALAELIDARQLVASRQIDRREQDWKNAYLSTPHGEPVKLENGRPERSVS